MFTVLQLVPSKRITSYYIWDSDRSTYQPDELPENQIQPTDSSSDKKPLIDFKVTQSKVDYIVKLEKQERLNNGFFDKIDTDFTTYMDLGYMPPSDKTKNVFIKKPIFSLNPESGSITIPEVSNDPIYEIKAGDTLSQIAKAYGMSLADLKDLNKDIKDPNSIKVGQSINVRGVQKTPVQVAGRSKNKVADRVVDKATVAVAEAPKTPQQKLDSAKLDMKQAQEVLTAAAKSGDSRAVETYTKALQTKIAKVGELQINVTQMEQVAKAQEAYDKLSPNQKILSDYQNALNSALSRSVELSASPYGKSREQVNSIFSDRASIAATITELRGKIQTCRTLISNDQKVAEINKDIQQKATYLGQTGEFAYKTEKQQDIAKISAENATLYASLDSGSIKPTMLAQARRQNNPTSVV